MPPQCHFAWCCALGQGEGGTLFPSEGVKLGSMFPSRLLGAEIDIKNIYNTLFYVHHVILIMCDPQTLIFVGCPQSHYQSQPK